MVSLTTTFKMALRRYGRVAAFVVLGMMVGATLTDFFRPPVEVPTVVVVEEIKTVAEPVRLRIPSVEIDTTFAEPLGVNDDQTVEVPDSYEAVGWYKHGPKPGELGPAVILGHVDSYQGPAVFYNLQFTKPGDIIEIERADGSVAKFEITELTHHRQSRFPTEAVYGNIDHAGLRLITCSGTYDRGILRYSHNLIVFAKLVKET